MAVPIVDYRLNDFKNRLSPSWMSWSEMALWRLRGSQPVVVQEVLKNSGKVMSLFPLRVVSNAVAEIAMTYRVNSALDSFSSTPVSTSGGGGQLGMPGSTRMR